MKGCRTARSPRPWIRRKARRACTTTTRCARSRSGSMRDCPEWEMRELLPDLLHERGPVEARERVRQHVASCDDCRAELALLAQIRAISVTPTVDTARIVSALPSP